jgi:hypothetical protein
MKFTFSALLATVLLQANVSADCRRSLSETAPVDKDALKAKLNNFLSITQKKDSRTLAAACPTFLKDIKKNTYPFECAADIGSFHCVIYDYFCMGETKMMECPIIGGFLGTASATPDGFPDITWLNGALIFPGGDYLIYNPVSAPLSTIEGDTVTNDVPFTSAKTNPLGNNVCGVDKLKSVSMEITVDCGIFGTLQFK